MPLHPSKLHVISVISNPVRYRSRAARFREFLPRIEASGATVWVVEAKFGERPFEVADADNCRHIKLRCDHELWLKEALINRAVQHLPHDWKYVAWVDADIEFHRPDWVAETLHALQHYDVVQPFSHAVDLGPNDEVLQLHTSFGYCYNQGHKLNIRKTQKYGGPFFHPGYAFAWRREAFEAVGGMMDFGICGAGDHHMACALIGEAKQSMPGGLHPNYYKRVYEWQERAEAAVRHNVGHIPGTILHGFHGWKADRKYQDRWEILKSNQFDPDTDIKRDYNGLPMLATDKRKLRDDLRAYFRARNEDALV